MDYVYSGKGLIEKKIKSLPYVKDYHVQKIENSNSRSMVTKERFKVRIWIVSNIYVMEILSGEPKIEDILSEIRKEQPISHDIFYV
jgi:hypothetical protein